MTIPYRTRRAEETLCKMLAQFPCCVITGPRQSGKTRLVRHCLGNSHRYVSLDQPDVRDYAREDPRLFLQAYPAPVVIDEIQYAPDLVAYIKAQIDSERDRMGQYVLTGSQMFPLMAGVGESLAGRTALLSLLPLTWGERCATDARSGPLARRVGRVPRDVPANDILQGLISGSYPEVVLGPERDIRLWYGAYVQTYLERDVRQVRNVGDLEEFQRFVRALVARHGALLNMAELSRDLGVALNTVKAWISVLVATHQVVLLRPYYRNRGKRLVKSPKVYFLDTGLVCYFAGIRSVEQLRSSLIGGAVLEGAFVAETMKWFLNRGEQPSVYLWRTSGGHEVDCVIEDGTHVWPYEVKLAATLKREMGKGMETFASMFPGCGPGRVIHLGREFRKISDRVEAVPFAWLQTW